MEIPLIDFDGTWETKLKNNPSSVIERLPSSCGEFTKEVLQVKGNQVSLIVCGDILYFVTDGKLCSGAILVSDMACNFCIRKTVTSIGDEYVVYAKDGCINQLVVPCPK
jgi:hypothetical protein